MSKIHNAMLGMLLVGFAGCATAPKSSADKADLQASAVDTVSRMVAADPSLKDLLASSAGYAVFPDVGKGALIVGGASGRGVLFANGEPVGFVRLDEASFGLQAGGETFSELIVLRNADGVASMKNDKFHLGAKASAVAIKSGAAAGASGEDGVDVFILPKGGLMVDVSVSGQQIRFTGRG